MTDQIRSAILGAIAALVGWLAVTSVSLLVQVAALEAQLVNHVADQADTEKETRRIEDKLEQKIELLRQLVEKQYGRTR